MNNVIIGANTEILVEILRTLNELHDSIAELKSQMNSLEADLQDIKERLNEGSQTEEGACCHYDY